MQGNVKKIGFFQRLLIKLKTPTENKHTDIYTRFLRKMLFFAVLAGALAVITVFAVLTIKSIGTPLTKVPSVIGMNVVDAALALEERGLVVQIDKKFDKTIDRFVVVEQYPSPGITVREDRVVKILVSMGKDTFIVPDLIGMNRNEAESILKQNKITYTVKIIQASEYQTNVVISQDLKAGQEVERFVKLQLLVNSDVKKDEYRVADFSKQPLEIAVKDIFDAGIIPKLEKVVTDLTEEDGLVLGQDIPPNSVVKKNSSVTLKVGVYGKDDMEKAKYTYHIFRYYLTKSSVPDLGTGASSGPSAQIKITVDDELNNEREIMNMPIEYNNWIVVTFKSFGKTSLYLTANSTFLREEKY